MPFGLSLYAHVNNVGPELAESICRDNDRVECTRDGVLVVPLPAVNRKLSYDAYPTDWLDNGTERGSDFRYSPNFKNEFVREVHDDVPTPFLLLPYQLKLEAHESHARTTYCQIVTGYSGGPMRFHRQSDSARMFGPAVHPTVSTFCSRKLAVLRLDRNAARGLSRMSLHRAEVAMVDDRIVVTHERLFRLARPPRTRDECEGALPAEFAAWQPALDALYERRECTATTCNGHYHLD